MVPGCCSLVSSETRWLAGPSGCAGKLEDMTAMTRGDVLRLASKRLPLYRLKMTGQCLSAMRDMTAVSHGTPYYNRRQQGLEHIEASKAQSSLLYHFISCYTEINNSYT